MVSGFGQRFCILTPVSLDKVFFTYIFFYFCHITFYLLESELQLFPFHFVLYRVIMFSFDLPGIGLRIFFHAFFL